MCISHPIMRQSNDDDYIWWHVDLKQENMGQRRHMATGEDMQCQIPRRWQKKLGGRYRNCLTMSRGASWRGSHRRNCLSQFTTTLSSMILNMYTAEIYWVVHPLWPQDFPHASFSGNLFAKHPSSHKCSYSIREGFNNPSHGNFPLKG